MGFIGEIDADTSCKIEMQILVDGFEDEEFLEFAVEHICELLGYIASDGINIRDIEGKIGSVRREVPNGGFPYSTWGG